MRTDFNASDSRFFEALERINGRLDRAQRELASGKRIFAASDEPDGISALLSVRSEFEANQQLSLNLGRTKAEVDAAENGLQTAVKVLERARVIAGQAQSGFNSEANFLALEQEAGDLTQQLLNVANLAIEGRYLFSGNSDGVQPFRFDPSLNAVTAYEGSAATRQSLFPGSSPFTVARSGGEIFDSGEPGKNAFAGLRELEVAIATRTETTPPDQAAIRTALENIESAFRHLSSQLSSYGAIQRRVVEATAAATATDLRLQSQLQRLEEADLTESIVNLQQAQFQQKAAIQARGSQQRTSLFDYLG